MPMLPFALTRRPSLVMMAGERTHVARELIDTALAEEQHAAYRAMLSHAGLQVVDLAALADHPDCAFVEDVAVVLPEIVVLTRPGAETRRGEVDDIAGALAQWERPMVRLAAPATLDGGDVLRLGRTLFVGLSGRTNGAGVAALAEQVEPHGYAVRSIPFAGALHLKTAVTAVDEETLLVNPAWLDARVFPGLSVLKCDAREPFGANVLRLPESLLAQASAPRTAELLLRRGFPVATVDIGEFAKAEAGLTCLSLLAV